MVVHRNQIRPTKTRHEMFFKVDEMPNIGVRYAQIVRLKFGNLILVYIFVEEDTGRQRILSAAAKKNRFLKFRFFSF